MASNTENLNLLMKNPSTDGADTFNVQTMLNDNWQKIDNNAGAVAQTLANILKPTTPPIIGLPPSTTPDGMFQALGNTGELHVWRKTVMNSQAGYDIGEVEAGFLGSGQNLDNSNCGVSFKYSNSISVSGDGSVQQNSATVRGPFSYNSSEPSTIQNLIRGKFVSMIATTNATFPSAVKGGVWYIPADANVSLITNGTSLGYPYNMCYVVDKMQEVKAYGTGTTTTYPVSTNPKAYQEGDDKQSSGYTLGDVQTGSFSAVGPNTTVWRYSDSVTVDDNGNISLDNYGTISVAYSDRYVSDNLEKLRGKFAIVESRSSDNPPYFDVGVCYFFPADVVFTIGTSLAFWYCNKYQIATGYAAIPAGTTIEYLGKLGDKARVQVVSYVGTGTYGESNPNSLTFDFVPKLLFVMMSANTNISDGPHPYANGWVNMFIWAYGVSNTFVNRYTLYLKQNNKTISWYSDANSECQCNWTNVKYTAIAIG